MNTLAEIQEWKKPLAYFIETTIGKSFVFLNGSREECRGTECNLGKNLPKYIGTEMSELKLRFLSFIQDFR